MQNISHVIVKKLLQRVVFLVVAVDRDGLIEFFFCFFKQ